MSTYIMVYTADEAFDTSDLPEEEITKQMKVWGEWLGSIGPRVKDEGDAFKFGGKVVSQDGTEDADNLMTGYSIIEAEDFDEAVAFARKCPAVAEGGKVHVYEAFGL